MRPLFARALSEHEALMTEANAMGYLRKQGWLKLYRSEAAFAAGARERELAAAFDLPHLALDRDGALAMEPALGPGFRAGGALAAGGQHHQSARRDQSLCGALCGARRHRADRRRPLAAARRLPNGGSTPTPGRSMRRRRCWRSGRGRRTSSVRSALRLPLAVKRGYHRHFRPRGNAGLTRPVVDAELGYCVAPMEQGLRLTTGAEFAARDAPPTPVQLDRLLPAARELFPLGEAVEATPWMGSRPCFANSRPVIGRAPGHPGLWLSLWACPLGAHARAR